MLIEQTITPIGGGEGAHETSVQHDLTRMARLAAAQPTTAPAPRPTGPRAPATEAERHAWTILQSWTRDGRLPWEQTLYLQAALRRGPSQTDTDWAHLVRITQPPALAPLAPAPPPF